ncbi:hypothetical protein [Pseudomonas sp. Q1-7]|uniref:hypothetical protein n=1 Tax=Pseudomonas sp. Q1-7 TaxID=3020843 RepID=UPI002300AF88|nr:hypothetical protein [Pseudomonas sp. Q1-7]
MDNSLALAELRRLSLHVAAAHIAMVAFLEEAIVPWSDDQVMEFECLCATESAALAEYHSFLGDSGNNRLALLPSPAARLA